MFKRTPFYDSTSVPKCFKCKKKMYGGDGIYGACHDCVKKILRKEFKKLRS